MRIFVSYWQTMALKPFETLKKFELLIDCSKTLTL
jgi:hypothetical protein